MRDLKIALVVLTGLHLAILLAGCSPMPAAPVIKAPTPAETVLAAYNEIETVSKTAIVLAEAGILTPAERDNAVRVLQRAIDAASAYRSVVVAGADDPVKASELRVARDALLVLRRALDAKQRPAGKPLGHVPPRLLTA